MFRIASPRYRISRRFDGKGHPNFFQNSCTGTRPTDSSSNGATTEDIGSVVRPVDKENGPKNRHGGKGWFTCCVPECISNSRVYRDLSFYAIPNCKSKDSAGCILSQGRT